MDTSRKKERDLSKAIALNKEPKKYKEILDSIKSNYINLGYHFNFNYSTAGHVLYYLVRMNPFTIKHLKYLINNINLILLIECFILYIVTLRQ